MSNQSEKTKLDYASAGVDIKAGEDAVEKIKELAKGTFGPNVLSEIGSFGGFFKPDFGPMKAPVLISSADGVGTKLRFAFLSDKHNTVGEDLVNHCVNDILVHGAKSLFFLDYIATGKLKQDTVAGLVEGLARGCTNGGMALLGGETAEMPGFYQPGEYDLAGFIVGMVDQDKIINGSTIKEGDVCIGIASNGLHTNGYTLARKILFEVVKLKVDDHVKELGCTVAEAFMRVHLSYATIIHALLEKHTVNGMAHITGGGIPGNLKRIIPDKLSARIDRSTWETPAIFSFLQEHGGVERDEMFSAFNMGIGYIVVVDKADTDAVMAELGKFEHDIYRIGEIVKGKNKVELA